jgi:hypothetical protein
MDWMPGGDWGFVKQVDDGNITSPASLGLPAAEVVEKLGNAEERRSASMMTAIQTHQSFWENKAPGGRFEHWRFADGVSENLDLCHHDGGLLDMSSSRLWLRRIRLGSWYKSADISKVAFRLDRCQRLFPSTIGRHTPSWQRVQA